WPDLAFTLKRQLDNPKSDLAWSGHSFRTLAANRTTIEGVIQAYAAELGRSDGRRDGTSDDEVIERWRARAKEELARLDPVFAFNDLPGGLPYGGYEWAELRAAIDAVRSRGLDPNTFSA